jgi:hypothetical protein
MTLGSLGILVKSSCSAPICRDDPEPQSRGEGDREEVKMTLETNERRQRLKRERSFPKWVRGVALLKWTFRVMTLLYRLWRFWNWLTGDPDS